MSKNPPSLITKKSLSLEKRNARITFEVYKDEKFLLQYFLPHGFLAIIGRFWVIDTLRLFQEEGIKKTIKAFSDGKVKITIIKEKRKK